MENGVAEGQIVRQHQLFHGHEFKQTLGDSRRQRSLTCCSPWGYKQLDVTSWLNSNNHSQSLTVFLQCISSPSNSGPILLSLWLLLCLYFKTSTTLTELVHLHSMVYHRGSPLVEVLITAHLQHCPWAVPLYPGLSTVHPPPVRGSSFPTGQWIIQIRYSILAFFFDHSYFQLLLVGLPMK